mmetsp:Transcript_23980/g.75058  ORF Transcript_23980/g.75058 Transcript_23980/m.75058 type:complete len:213 (+) Transcript_23980:70-708(+)
MASFASSLLPRRLLSSWAKPGGISIPFPWGVRHLAAFSGSFLPGLWYTNSHMWVKASLSAENPAETMLLECGITEHALDTIGDIEKFIMVAEQGEAVGPNAMLANLFWSGYVRSASDEIYHARWGNVEGTHGLSLPVGGRVIAFNQEVVEDPDKALTCSEDPWVVKLEVGTGEVEAAVGSLCLLSPGSYRDMLARRAEEEEEMLDGTGARRD